MKKIIIAFLITLSIILLLNNKTVFAQGSGSCSSFTVSPPSGPSNTVFTLTASGCLTNAIYNIGIVDKNGNGPHGVALDTGRNGTLNYIFSSLQTEGSYEVSLYDPQYNKVNSTSINITSTTGVKCGDTVTQNSTLCPSPCPAQNKGSGVWICEASTTVSKNTTIVGSITCNGGNGVSTAIGCIPINDTSALVGFILGWGIGIGGGIAFILILIAGFQIMTSRGDPKRLQAGQELLTSAIAGLLMLIFSVFILRIIGVNILNITGFGQ